MKFFDPYHVAKQVSNYSKPLTFWRSKTVTSRVQRAIYRVDECQALLVGCLISAVIATTSIYSVHASASDACPRSLTDQQTGISHFQHTLERLRNFLGRHNEAINSVLSPDNQHLLQVFQRWYMSVTDIESGSDYRINLAISGEKSEVKFAPGGTTLAITGFSDAGTTSIFDVQNHHVLNRFQNHLAVRAFDYDATGEKIIFVYSNGSLAERDVRTGSLLKTFELDKGISVSSAKLFADAHRVMIAADRNIKIWNLESFQQISLYLNESPIIEPKLSADNTQLLVMTKSGVSIFSTETGQNLHNLPWSGVTPVDVTYAQNQNELLMISQDGGIMRFDLTTLRPIETINVVSSTIHGPYRPDELKLLLSLYARQSN